MGLDSVELLYTLEEAFEVEIPNLEAEKISTVDELVEAFYEKVSLAPSQSCLTQLVFYKLRKAFWMLGHDKTAIQPSTTLHDLLSQELLIWEWSMIEQKIDLKLPKLVKLDFDHQKNRTITILGYKVYERAKAITSHSLRTLTDWVIALNHGQLINKD